MRNKFDMQLGLLNEQLIHMGELCELAINRATKALQKGSIEEAKHVIDADQEIDQMEKDIERLCLKLLLQQQPVARDLRQISAALKMITDMERIGDQASDIAEIIISEKKSEVPDLKKIGAMSEAVAKMVRDSVTSYVEKDLELCRKVMGADDDVDLMFEDTKKELIESIAENKGDQGKEDDGNHHHFQHGNQDGSKGSKNPSHALGDPLSIHRCQTRTENPRRNAKYECRYNTINQRHGKIARYHFFPHKSSIPFYFCCNRINIPFPGNDCNRFCGFFSPGKTYHK